MRIRYFFTNKRDQTPNNIIWQAAPRPLLIRDVRDKLSHLGVIDNHSHLRFRDKIKGEKVWLDIVNDGVECPSNSEGVVDVKIVQQFHEGSQAFLSDVFGGVEGESYEKLVGRLRKMLLLKEDSKNESQPEKVKKESESGYVKFQDKDEEEFGEEDFEGEEGRSLSEKSNGRCQ